MKWIKTFFWMIIFTFVVFFSMQNKEEVTLRLSLYPIRDVQWELPKVPLFLVMLCSLFLGVLIGGISDFYRRFQLRKILRENQKKIERMEQEIQSLRGPGLDQPSFLKKADFS